jgi:hypothetical protein
MGGRGFAMGGRGCANGMSSPLMMPPPKFPVASSTVVFRQNSMISKKICDITEFPEFQVKSTHTVHFRELDDKVSFPDLSVRMGVYSSISEAHRATLQLIEKEDIMVNDLHSLEVDDNLHIVAGKSVILMSFPDAITLLHRLGVRTCDAVIKPQVKATAAFDATRPVAAIIRMRKVPASVLKTISAIEHLDDCPHGKELRQIEQGEIDANGQNISGFWNIADVGAAYLYDDPKNAIRWAKGITIADASSLIKIPSGNPSVS